MILFFSRRRINNPCVEACGQIRRLIDLIHPENLECLWVCRKIYGFRLGVDVAIAFGCNAGGGSKSVGRQFFLNQKEKLTPKPSLSPDRSAPHHPQPRHTYRSYLFLSAGDSLIGEARRSDLLQFLRLIQTKESRSNPPACRRSKIHRVIREYIRIGICDSYAKPRNFLASIYSS